LVRVLFKDYPKKLGKVDFSFDLTPLQAGVYYLYIKIGKQVLKTEKIIKI